MPNKAIYFVFFSRLFFINPLLSRFYLRNYNIKLVTEPQKYVYNKSKIVVNSCRKLNFLDSSPEFLLICFLDVEHFRRLLSPEFHSSLPSPGC